MFLPTKGITHERALITVGAEVLDILQVPTSVSGLWEQYNRRAASHTDRSKITFDWFSYALAGLFAVEAVDWTEDGRLRRGHVSA